MTTYKARLDSISIFFSALCIVHCILLPIAFTTLPLWGFEVLENRFLEAATILVSLVVGGWAIWRGYRRYHHRLMIPVLFLLGLLLMTAGNFVASEAVEAGFKGVGAVLVIAAHLWNWSSCRRCAMCAA